LATTSQSVSHTVSRADTATTLTVTNPSIVYGNASHFAVAIAPPGTGNVSLTIDGTNVGTTTLTAGTAIFDVPLLGAGTHSISASYAGDTNFNASTSAPAQEIVAKAATSVSGSAHPSPAYAGMSVGITATVHATAAATPTGSIAAAISIRSLTTQSLTGGSATLTLSPLPVGQNTITLTYSGDGNFEPSSTTINETVLPPAISASDVTTTGDVRHSITVPLTLSAPMSLPASVDFATNDATAHAGTEYVAAQGSVSIPAGQTSATLTLDIVGNASAAPLTFSLRFSKPVNASLLTDSITVTINGSGTATTYEYAPGLTIDLYGSSGRAPALPLILAIPGTSAYDSARGAIPALRETARGYAVARIAYTAAPSAHFPAQLDNLAAAVAWIRDHASMLNIDPTRIGAWGYGSGANLAALLGTSDAHLVAVIEESGATDLPSLAADSLACNSGDHSAESDLLGCALDACGAAASPTRNASAASAATLIIHGENDCVVGPEQATRLYDALRNAGVYTFLDLVRNGGHEDASGNADVAGEIDSFLDVHLLRLGARPRPSRH
ncbi:MAG TPA: Ig-like domain repeat protein, partial [Vicinamibacterales bacterium]